MLSDCMFVMGSNHTECQDYALASPGKVVLSDGCSSSLHTDVGARLLCNLALTSGPETAVFSAAPIVRAMGASLQCLDATLLTATRLFDRIRTTIMGDGVVVARKRAGGFVYTSLEFPSDAPRYASYDLDPARRAEYLRVFGDQIVVTTFDGVETTQHLGILTDEMLSPFVVDFPTSEYDLVLILSDGVSSFRKPSDTGGTKPVPIEEIILELLRIHVYTHPLITRRARRFLRDSSNLWKWTHSDDFSVAAIYVGDEAT